MKFKDCTSEINGTNEVAVFAIGLKLRMRLVQETMISTSDITDPKWIKTAAPSHLEAGAVLLFEIVQ